MQKETKQDSTGCEPRLSGYRSLLQIAGVIAGICFVFRTALGLDFTYDDWYYMFAGPGAGPIAWFDFRATTTYRPYLHAFFGALNPIFGLNPLPYHVIHLFWFCANTALMFLLVSRVTRNQQTAFTATVFFSWHTIHASSLYWLSCITQTACTTFVLLALLFYWKGTRITIWLSVVCCLLAILGREQAISVAGVIFVIHAWRMLRQGVSLRASLYSALLKTVPYLILVFVFLVARLMGQAALGGTAYQFKVTGGHVLRNWARHTYWGLQMFIDPVVKLFAGDMAVGPAIKQMANENQAVIVVALAVLAVLLIGVVVAVVRMHRENRMWLLFLLFWSAVAMGPAWFLVDHQSPYYFEFSLIPVSIGFGFIVSSVVRQIRLSPSAGYAVVVAVYLFLVYVTITGINANSIYVKGSEVVKALREFISTPNGKIPKGSQVAVFGIPGSSVWVLQKDFGLRLLTGDDTLSVWDAYSLYHLGGRWFIKEPEMWPGTRAAEDMELDANKLVVLGYYRDKPVSRRWVKIQLADSVARIQESQALYPPGEFIDTR